MWARRGEIHVLPSKTHSVLLILNALSREDLNPVSVLSNSEGEAGR
jgi:hypothetical protein